MILLSIISYYLYHITIYDIAYIRKLQCSVVQRSELKNAVAGIHARPCIAKSTCTFPCKSVHPLFRASPCSSVQAGLHI